MDALEAPPRDAQELLMTVLGVPALLEMNGKLPLACRARPPAH